MQNNQSPLGTLIGLAQAATSTYEALAALGRLYPAFASYRRPSQLCNLPWSEARPLIAFASAAYRNNPTWGYLFCLALLCAARLPQGDTQTSPSEILEWLAEGAISGLNNPVICVRSRVINKWRRQARFVFQDVWDGFAAKSKTIQVEDIIDVQRSLPQLSPTDRQGIAWLLKGFSIEEISGQWKFTRTRGLERLTRAITRLKRLRSAPTTSKRMVG